MDKITQRIIVIFIVFAVFIGIATGAGVYIYTSGVSNDIIDSWIKQSDNWETRYDSLNGKYDDLEDDYLILTNDYNDLLDDYNSLYSPCTLIKNGNITWRFDKLDGTVVSWKVDIDTYRYYVSCPDPTGYVRLYNSGTGKTYTIKDITKYVQPDFFSEVISDLTDGNTDYKFVDEVVNLKNQLISYGSGLDETYQWSAETLTECRGKCGDTSILVASLIKAGENKANYGLKVSLWYCDVNNMDNPQDINHVIVGVEYSDGDYDLIETTTNNYYSYEQIFGWKYEV